MMNIKGRKGIAPIVIVLVIFAIILLFYVVLYLPIPAFKALRYTINYFAILLIFFSIQVGIVYLYYKGISYFTKGFNDIKKGIMGYTEKFKQYIHIKMRV